MLLLSFCVHECHYGLSGFCVGVSWFIVMTCLVICIIIIIINIMVAKWWIGRPGCVALLNSFVGKIKGKVLLGIHRHKWKDIIKVDLKEIHLMEDIPMCLGTIKIG
jgi:hypothetical protein